MNRHASTVLLTGSRTVAIWFVDLCPPAPIRQSILAFLSAGERNHATMFRSHYARSTFQIARATLRLHLARYTGAAPHELLIDVGERGKPFLAGQDAHAPLRFNVSHSHGLALMCFSRSHEIGIDIEKIRLLPDARLIAEQHFAPTELKSVIAREEEGASRCFLACWTRKEALVKGLGHGLHMPLRTFDVTPARSASAVAWRCAAPPATRWFTAQLALPVASHCGAVALSAVQGLRAFQPLRPVTTEWDPLLVHCHLQHHSWASVFAGDSKALVSSR
jgi:4'-phosphopantetheinyl transferase